MGLTLEIDKKPLQPGYVQMSLVIQWEFPIIIKKTAIAMKYEITLQLLR